MFECVGFANCFIQGKGSHAEACIAWLASMHACTPEVACLAVSTDSEEVENEISAIHQGQPIWSVLHGWMLNCGRGPGGLRDGRDVQH